MVKARKNTTHKNMELQPHQQRVVDEKAELDEKLDNLMAFTCTSPIFETLPTAEKGRLLEQRRVMHEYSKILGERIAAFPSE